MYNEHIYGLGADQKGILLDERDLDVSQEATLEHYPPGTQILAEIGFNWGQ
ncbi:hypothetical protein [Roseovarius atlanticus]|uniref:hypothetical protein n=1 Tax=Roseovarius atlanticus TaxID=1641875 RepID=UPI001C96B120|nr:hypothetical protein [Roseovarius atlanticus]MBY6127049.1 hypothetical protein [Roseovarius atlanticus]MBY6151543.1 hypothetical protein [Roseovarius atlanticus]